MPELPLIVAVTLLWVPWTAGVIISREEVAKLAKLSRGTELVYIQDSYNEQKSYPRLEDFFWTGSGDGPDPEETDQHWPLSTEEPSTIFTTKTVLSTVFITRTPIDNQTGLELSPSSCIHDCDGITTPKGEINPTPTLPNIETNTFKRPEHNDTTADRHFWLLTVLKDGRKEPIPDELENSLAKLYKKAFQRQQERHLGITKRSKRATNADDKPIVHAYIHNIEKSKVNDDEKIEVIYHVSVAGHPVAAVTAAQDMQLVSDEEVIQELGYPILTKAEPYLKEAEPQSLAKTHTTWIFVGVALALICILLIIVLILTISMNKRKKSGIGNRQRVFGKEMGAEGQVNKGYAEEDPHSKYQSGRRRTSPTYINFKGNDTLRSGTSFRPSSSRSTSTTSGSSIDISPLMSLNNKQRSPMRKHLRSKGSTNRTAPLPPQLSSSDSGSDHVDRAMRKNHEVISPKSYLSMPSIKSFPRGNNPEPLNRVLEPVSVLHLDMIEDNEDDEDGKHHFNKQFTRHGSMGAEDPGVIGPLVWDLHCHRMQKNLHIEDDSDDQKIPSNVSRMRKRFHELLDDTFSLFGSRRDSVEDITIRPPKPQPRALFFENRGHSAIEKNDGELTIAEHLQRQRPRTSDPRRLVTAPGSEPPRGAWGSNVPSPLVRPLSAPYRRPPVPNVDVQHVLAEGNFQPNDPAVPLIEAIKTELGKTSLPGSTANLAE